MREEWVVEGRTSSSLEEEEEEEAWNSPEFLQLSRRQQNVEIFKVRVIPQFSRDSHFKVLGGTKLFLHHCHFKWAVSQDFFFHSSNPKGL